MTLNTSVGDFVDVGWTRIRFRSPVVFVPDRID